MYLGQLFCFVYKTYSLLYNMAACTLVTSLHLIYSNLYYVYSCLIFL